jgi:hypothetical protein
MPSYSICMVSDEGYFFVFCINVLKWRLVYYFDLIYSVYMARHYNLRSLDYVLTLLTDFVRHAIYI